MLEIQWERENRLLLSWSLHSTGEADNEQTSRCLTYQWCQVLGESKRKGNRYCQVKLIFLKKLIDWLDICRKGTTIGKYPACVLSCVQLFAAPWTVALQAPLSMEFSRQEYYTPGDLPDPGIQPTCPVHWQAHSLSLSHLGSFQMAWVLPTVD